MNDLIFAANWKMHHGPKTAQAFFDTFFSGYETNHSRDVWFFTPDVSLPHAVGRVAGQAGMLAGVQNVYWEPKGAFTGETSVAMAAETGAGAALVGHSERRHVFGETDEETGKKVRAVLAGGLIPVLCVGEKQDEREAGATANVVTRQLAVLEGLNTDQLERVVIAYEPVWAIGTGLTATPEDAAETHREIRRWLIGQNANPAAIRILYGGSVKPANAASLISEDEIDGVLVGGASLDAGSWTEILRAGVD